MSQAQTNQTSKTYPSVLFDQSKNAIVSEVVYLTIAQIQEENDLFRRNGETVRWIPAGK